MNSLQHALLVFLAFPLALGGCSGAGESSDAGSGSIDSGRSDRDAVEDAGELPDVPGSDSSRPDTDRDGVPDPEDCDPVDAAVGREGTRGCAGVCGAGQESCMSGIWGACEDLDPSCVCDTPGASRDSPCGMCGRRPERCTAAGVWEPRGECADEGVCVPGTEIMYEDSCGTYDGICTDTCVWDAIVVGTPGECNAGERECDPRKSGGRLCTDFCRWGPWSSGITC